MAHYKTVQNEVRNYMSNGPREEVHEIPSPATLDEIGLGISGLGKHIEDLTGKIAIKEGGMKSFWRRNDRGSGTELI